MLIDGERFRTESREAIYEGIFNINVEAHEIDIEFIEGPEAGNWNFGVFRFNNEDRLEICLELNGKQRPGTFSTSPGSGCAYEILERTSHSRPENVTGGTSPTPQQVPPAPDSSGFEFVESASFTRLQGQWTPVKVIRDGQELPAMLLRTGLRIAEKKRNQNLLRRPVDDPCPGENERKHGADAGGLLQYWRLMPRHRSIRALQVGWR